MHHSHLPHHHTRAHRRNDDAAETLKKLTVLKGILPEKPVPNQSREGTGFMLHSRFNNQNNNNDDDDDDTPKYREKQQKSTELEDGANVVEHKSHHSTESVGTVSEKNRRYALSLATLANKPSKRMAIVQEGAIQILIELSQLHDRTIQVRCASAFASLSVEPEIRVKMLDDGALPAIAALAGNTNIREIKVDCSRAICNLGCVPNYEFKLLKEGVPFAVMNIASACPETYETCLKILLNLSCVTEKLARIEEVTEALVFFLSCILPLKEEIYLLQAFCNLSALRNNQLRLVEDGALRVVDRYYRSRHLELRKLACEMLKNFTIDYRSRAKLIELNILSTIVEMASDEHEEIRMQAAKCFLFLSKDRNFRKKIINSTAFELIMKTCRVPDLQVDIGQVVAKTLRILCADSELSDKLIEDGIGISLKSLMGIGDKLINQFCLEGLCALFQQREALKSLIQEGVHFVIVKLVQDTDPKEHRRMQEWASFALFQITASRFCGTRTIEEKILPCILLLCKEEASSLTMSFCAAALASASSLIKIDCSVAIPLLVKMLGYLDDGHNIKKFCATALFNLATTEENCDMIFAADALKPVVQLTQSMETKVICAGIISRLSLHKRYYSQFASGDVLKVLLELSCVDDRLTQRRVVIALSNLSQDEELRQKLLLLNPISYIVSLAAERDEYLRRGCISIVCNMSYQLGSEETMVQAGIIPTLMITSLITTDQFISRIICVKALVNLMADRRQYKSIVKDGAIWALSKLGMMENDELTNLCASALCRLSVEFARAMITSAVTVRTVLSFLQSDDLSLKKPGARTLTNLLLETKESDEDFRQHVVQNMHPISTTNDEELNELCVICLCLASQSETCRSTIVSSGMLKQIDPSTIFSSDKTISYAYITMFSNIAIDPNMRKQVLDDQLISRLERILESHDSLLTFAAIKALYCVSCSKENIPKLVEQNIIQFIKGVIQEHVVLVPIENHSENKIAGEGSSKVADVKHAGHSDAKHHAAEKGSTAESKHSTLTYGHHVESKAESKGESKDDDMSNSYNQSVDDQELQSQPTMREEIVMDYQLRHHLLGCLFNLCNHEEVAQSLVSAGIVRILVQLWDEAMKDVKMARLIIFSICHLACARTNSKQMVQDGCTPILCFITEHRKLQQFATYTWSIDMYVRCSAAFRNLLSVVSNQTMMMQQGCLPVLIQLANHQLPRQHGHAMGSTILGMGGVGPGGINISNPNLTGGTMTGTGNNDGSNNSVQISVGSTGMNYTEASKTVRNNCASTLKSLTYNQDLRMMLIETEAIKIILAEVKKESDLQISNGLLKELEAESWDNGGRFRQKEGRAKSLSASPIYTELLKGGTNVQLNVLHKDIELSKYHVQIQLDEDHPPMTDDECSSTGSPVGNSPVITGKGIGTRASSLLMGASFLTRENSDTSLGSVGNAGPHNHNASGHNLLHAKGNLDSPNPNSMESPTAFKQSASFRKHKLHKLVTQANMVAMSEEEGQNGHSSKQINNATASGNMTEGFYASDLSIDQLSPLEDNDEAMGMNPMGYHKQPCEVEVDTVALIRLDSYENNNNNLNGYSNASYNNSASGGAGGGTNNSANNDNYSVGNNSTRDIIPNPTGANSNYHSGYQTNNNSFYGDELVNDGVEGQMVGGTPVYQSRMTSFTGNGNNNIRDREHNAPVTPIAGIPRTSSTDSGHDYMLHSHPQYQQFVKEGPGTNVSLPLPQPNHVAVANHSSTPPSGHNSHRNNNSGSNKKDHPPPPMDSITIPDISQHLKRRPNQPTYNSSNIMSQSQLTQSLPLITPSAHPNTGNTATFRATNLNHRPDEGETISNIVMIIKKAREGKDPTKVDDALAKWKSIARY